MIAKLIGASARNLVLVLIATVFAVAAGLYALVHLPLDAIPDLSDTQVIVYTEYPGQAPQVIEDQVTYPLTTAMLTVPKSKVVRGFSFFGVSFVYVIFEDGTDIYWARSRVLEFLNGATSRLPAGVTPTIGPDATGVGWVYQYAVMSKELNLSDTRTIQDWNLKFALAKAEGVAEVASVGGFVKQYNVILDPQRMRDLGITIQRMRDAIRASNADVGGRTVELSEFEYVIRGKGYLKSINDLGNIVLKTDGGTPVLLRDVARVELGPDERRGITELNGEGEVASGIVLQRFGVNALDVIENVKKRFKEIASSLPKSVEIVPVYDRSNLIYAAIDTLKHTLVEESIVVALVCIVFLLHFRSALVAILMLPVGVLMAFGAMKLLGLGSNIMSLGGIAIAIGAMVDAAIVMIENAHKHLERAEPGRSRIDILIAAASQVGPALFFSLLIITVSFMPIFTLESQEGRLFSPLAFTKTGELMQTQDKIIRSFPEVASVYGKAGRAATATDPAPSEMFETVVNLKPKQEWRPGITVDGLIAEMDKALQFPGVSNAWTMPIKARIDMLSTGIRTPIGVKVIGIDLVEIDKLAKQIEQVLKSVPGTSSAYAERGIGGYYLDVTPDRAALARYGIMVQDVQDVVATALGGQNVTTTVEGRQRFGVNMRYPRDLRSDPQAIARDVLVPMPAGGAVPLGEVAKVAPSRGPTSIRTENGQLATYIYVDIRDRDLGGYVADAQQAVKASIQFPAGSYVMWSGQYEYLERATARLKIVVPVTLLIIFLLLYLNFRSITETMIVMLSLPFALVGGLWLMWWLGFNLSVAVAVGFIALAGVAAETGVVMLIYLNQALAEIKAQRDIEGRALTRSDLYDAIMEGAVERVRPKMMTVVAIMAGLLPIMWSTGTGSEIMQRIAVPMIGGMVSSTLLTLIVIPAIFGIVKGFRLPIKDHFDSPPRSASRPIKRSQPVPKPAE